MNQKQISFRLKLLASLGLLALISGACISYDLVGYTQGGDANAIEIQRQTVARTYFQWSRKLIEQDYAGAMALVVPASDGARRTDLHKKMWDLGGESYDDITHVEAWLTDDGLAMGYAEAVGNMTFFQLQYQDTPPLEEEEGFYSSARKIDGTWKIDEFNTNDEPDWWR